MYSMLKKNAEEKKGNVEIEAEKGTFVSVLPFGDEVIISDSCGTKYEYKDLRITRVRAGVGISNEAEEKTVRFRIKKGSALIFVGDKKKIKFKTRTGVDKQLHKWKVRKTKII